LSLISSFSSFFFSLRLAFFFAAADFFRPSPVAGLAGVRGAHPGMWPFGNACRSDLI
jgi:hypothetical protein